MLNPEILKTTSEGKIHKIVQAKQITEQTSENSKDLRKRSKQTDISEQGNKKKSILSMKVIDSNFRVDE